MYISKFGGYTMPAEQLEVEESHGAGRRGATMALSGLGGSFDHFGSSPDPLQEDEIGKAFIIEAASGSALQTAVDGFIGTMMLSQTNWRQGARILIATMPDGSQRQTWAKCVEARARWEYFNINQHWVPVQVTFRRAWPVWEPLADIIYFGDHLGTFADTDTAGYDFGDGQAMTEQAASATTTTFTITNNGNGRVAGGVIELDGAIIDPKLENLTNGHWWQWTGTLAAGDRLTFYLAGYDVRKNGEPGEWPNVVLGSDYGQILPMILEPGANSMRLTGDGTVNCTLRYWWARVFM